MRISDWSSDVCSSDLQVDLGNLRLREHGEQLWKSQAEADSRSDAQRHPEREVALEHADRASGRLAAGYFALNGPVRRSFRSEGRRGGKECGRPCRSRGSPAHKKKKTTKETPTI